MAEIIQNGRFTVLHYSGFLYTPYSRNGTTRYWRCNRGDQCAARLVTKQDGHEITVSKGGGYESHLHAPNPEEVQAVKLLASLKKEACEHPETPLSWIMLRLQDVSPAVLAHLPDRINIRKQIQRYRLKKMHFNP